MPKLNDIFGGNFLKADDLQGRSVPVTIDSVEVKEFDDGKKLILKFQGKDKALVCNRTNASIIEEVIGSGDTDDWIGQKITLITKKVEFQGKLVPAIRVKLEDGMTQINAPARQQPAAAPQGGNPEEDDQSVPF